MEPHPYESKVVERMFKEALQGSGLTEITKGLNRDGITSVRGKTWGKTSVYAILTNEVYIGTLVWSKQSKKGLPPVRVENAWSAIVSSQDFKQVQSLLKQRAPAYLHPRRTASEFLLSGIAKCGHCSKALVGNIAKGGKFSYYVCGSLLKKGAGACPAKYINSKKLELAVIEKIKEHILTEENLRELVKLVNEAMDSEATEYKAQFELILEEIADIDCRLGRLYHAIETAKVTEVDLGERIRHLKERKEKLMAKKWELDWQLKERSVELADMETMARYVKDLRNLLKDGSLTERRSFIRSFIKEAVVKNNEVTLEYTFPMIKSGQQKENLGVLSTVHDGGPKCTIDRTFSLSFSLSK